MAFDENDENQQKPPGLGVAYLYLSIYRYSPNYQWVRNHHQPLMVDTIGSLNATIKPVIQRVPWCPLVPWKNPTEKWGPKPLVLPLAPQEDGGHLSLPAQTGYHLEPASKYRKYMGCKSMFLILPQIWDGKVLGRKPAELSIPLSCFECGTGCTVLKFEFGIGSGTAKNIFTVYTILHSCRLRL